MKNNFKTLVLAGVSISGLFFFAVPAEAARVGKPPVVITTTSSGSAPVSPT